MIDIVAASGARPQGAFRIRHIVITAVNVYRRNFLNFTFVSGLISLPILLASDYIQSAPAGISQYEPLLIFALTLTLQPLSTAIVLNGAFQDMRGQPVRLGESIAAAIARMPTLFGLTVLMTLITMLGLVLLIVPGLMLLARWYVAVPVCMVERRDPVSSLDRSQWLTKGHRWVLFGLYLFVVILATIGDSVSARIGFTLRGDAGSLACQTVWWGISEALGSVMIVVAYHDLRVAKEGIDIDLIASVFE